MMEPSFLVGWIVRVLLSGGFVLLLTCAAVRLCRQPARRQRVAEWGLLGGLLAIGLSLAPSWLNVPLLRGEEEATARVEPPAPVENAAPLELEDALALLPEVGDEEIVAVDPFVPSDEQVAPTPSQPAEVAVAQAAEPENASLLLPVCLSLYLTGVFYFIARLIWGHVQLARFLATARPVSQETQQLFESMTPSSRRPRLLMSDLARVPLSCGVLRPTIVLPSLTGKTCDESALRWVLAHELAHLRRRDALTSLLFGMARSFYYVLPWFWWLRRQVVLCQEYVADAAAAETNDSPEDYAAFLLHWSTAPAIPVGATGVSGQPSDLFRRISMLLQRPMKIEERCPRRWSLLAAGALLSLAVVVAGVGLSHAAPADDTKKDKEAVKDPTKADEPKKEEPKKEEPKKTDPLFPGFPDIEDLLKGLPGGLDDATLKRIREQLEMTKKLTDQLQKQMPNAGRGGIIQFPQIQFPNIQIPNVPNVGRFNLVPGRRGLGGMMQETRLGASLNSPSATLVDQLDLPKDQGLILEDVRDDSAAAKAGLKKYDILLELNGKPVSSDMQAFAKQLQDIKPDEAVDAVVLRKSKKETVKGIKLPKAEVQPNVNPFNLPINPFGGLGNAFGNVRNISMMRTNDSFTLKSNDGDVNYVITGKIEDGKATTTEINIDDKKYESVEKVPAEHREKVSELVKYAEGNRGIRRGAGRR